MTPGITPQLPVGATNDPGISGQPNPLPPQIQQLVKMLQAAQAQGGAVAGASPGVSSMPASLPAAAPSIPPTMPAGSMAAGLPQMAGGPAPSSGAQPVLPRGASPSANPSYQSGFNFPNAKARTGAVVTNMMQGLSDFEAKREQQKYQKQTEEARGVVATMLRMGIAAENSQDPDAKKLLQQKANEMLGAKESAKILKDINKPGSAAYFGAQQAYKDVMAEASQKLTMQELQARIQAEQERARAETSRQGAEQARQKHEETLTEQAGTVTPKDKAELEQKNKQAQLVVDTLLKRTQMTTDAGIKMTQMRVDAIRAATKDKKGDKTLDNLAKEYTNLKSQFTNLDTQARDLTKDLADHPLENWFHGNEAQQKKNQLTGIKAQQDMLTQQMKFIEQKRETMQKFGVINVDITPPAAAPGGEVTDDQILQLLNK